MKESHRSLFHVFHPLADDAADVLVGQGIIEGLAIPAEFDQLAAPQDPQLVGDGGLGQSQQISDVAHARLGPEQGVEDLDPGGIPEDLEQVGLVAEHLIRRQDLTDLVHRALVHLGDLTVIDEFHSGLLPND